MAMADELYEEEEPKLKKMASKVGAVGIYDAMEGAAQTGVAAAMTSATAGAKLTGRKPDLLKAGQLGLVWWNITHFPEVLFVGGIIGLFLGGIFGFMLAVFIKVLLGW